MERILELDRSLTLALNGWNCPAADAVMVFASRVWVWVPFYIFVIIWLFCRKNWRYAAIWVAVFLLGVLLSDRLSFYLKEAIGRLRPFADPLIGGSIRLLEEPGSHPLGFPSGHACNTFCFALLSSVAVRRRWWTPIIFCWAALLSYSRIYVGKHFLGDVLAGALLGLAIAGVLLLIRDIIRRRRCPSEKVCVPGTRGGAHKRSAMGGPFPDGQRGANDVAPESMLCIIDNTTDPYWNLAAEEWLLTHHDEPVFRLWRNDNAVIVGRNQNARAEIDTDFVREHDIAVVRRLTGGGAVFHDLGNVNYTFIERAVPGEDSGAMFRRFTAPVIEALRSLGVDARLEGRNDLLIGDAKFSGNAMCIHNGRVLQHGTLLFSSKVSDIAGALIPRQEKYAGRGVKSVRSRVTNISEYLREPMTVEEFISFLSERIGAEFTPYSYSEEDLAGISKLADEKYRTEAWNYGTSPACTFRKAVKYPGGLVEIYMDIRGGRIADIDIRGDYFFNAPTSGFCEAMKGCQHSEEKIAGRLRELATGEYFCGISPEELLQLFF